VARPHQLVVAVRCRLWTCS